MTQKDPSKTGLRRLALAALICLAAAGCTTTGSSASRDDASPRGSVTIFGDIDAGVSRVRN